MLMFSQLNPTGGRLSSYAKALPKSSPNVCRRYLEKIRIIGYYDPYNPSFFARGSENLAIPTSVTTGHVIDYLLSFVSPYSGQPMKNSRSMEGYKKFESGFVHSVQGTIREGYHVLVGKVIHSMKLKENMLKPWIIIDKRGRVIYAHYVRGRNLLEPTRCPFDLICIMADSEDQKLNAHFKEDMCSIISLLFLCPPEVRQMARSWMTTFYNMGGNILDKQMRNRYTAYMLMQLELNRTLSKPFDEPAPDHIHLPLVKIIDADTYIQFFERCEKYYLTKKGSSGDQEMEDICMKPSDFLYRLPPIQSGVVVYGACFSKNDQ
nr:uncharacterized protein LOC109427196 [Aedes albopictus]